MRRQISTKIDLGAPRIGRRGLIGQIGLLTAGLLTEPSLTACGRRGATFFVSPHGRDTWSGASAVPNAQRTDGPFRTIERARQAVRAYRRGEAQHVPVTVWLRGGRYFLSEPLIFVPEDSGFPDAPTTYVAYPNEQPTLSGGRPIIGWRWVRVHGKSLWATHIPEVAAGRWFFRQLFVNGQRRPRPRLPTAGFYQVVSIPDTDARTPWNQGQIRFTFRPGDIQRWTNLPDVDVVALHFWIDEHLPIKEVDESAHLVTFTRPSTFRLTEAYGSQGARYYVENVFEALDRPGQWYLDRPTGTLYYYPFPDEHLETADVVAPRLSQVVRVQGDVVHDAFVEDLILVSLTFAHTEWALPPNIASAPQAAVNVPGAVYLRGARSCRLTNCTVTACGTYAIEVDEGCGDVRLEKNHLVDLGAGGVKVGAASARTTIADNVIADGGKIFHAAVGIWVGDSPENRILRNRIHDLYYTGISVGWVWGYGLSRAIGNLVDGNHVYQIGRGWLSDMGGIYTLGVSPGTRLSNNRVHDVQAYAYGGWGIYLDEGSSLIRVEDNLVYRLSSAGLHQHYGQENVIRNNVFAFGAEGQVQRTTLEDHRSFTFERNIVYFSQGELLLGSWERPGARFDDNVYEDTSGRPIDFAGRTFAAWQALGMDRHSRITDPRFIDPAHDDFALRPTSPALALGFVPLVIAGSPPPPTIPPPRPSWPSSREKTAGRCSRAIREGDRAFHE